MIFVFILLLVTSLTVFVSPVTVNRKRDSGISAVLNDITDLQADVADLGTALNAIPTTGTNIPSVAAAMINAVNSLVTLTQLTADVQSLGTTIDPTDAETILAELTTIQQGILGGTTTFVSRENVLEGAFTGIGFFAVANAKDFLDEMINAVFQAVPVQNQAAALALKDGLDSALTSASAAFPSCDSLISISI